MRVEVNLVIGVLRVSFSRDQALGGWIHARRTARDDVGARHLRDGCGAECDATGAA